jgi:hypothetical protein
MLSQLVKVGQQGAREGKIQTQQEPVRAVSAPTTSRVNSSCILGVLYRVCFQISHGMCEFVRLVYKAYT